MNHRRFPSKLLIAGEFTVLNGGDALAIPLKSYSGAWEKSELPDPTLFPFAEYLLGAAFIHSDRLTRDLHQGWQFHSTIPAGYGLGSSGALSAAVYHHYRKSDEKDLEEIQKQLAFIEDFYHGKSSGFDPLISYKNQGYGMIDSKLVPVPDLADLKQSERFRLYLLDSGTLRGKVNSIQWFYGEMEKQIFKEKIKTLTELNHDLIKAWFEGKVDEFPELFRLISILQFEYFQPLITPSVLSTWAHGLDNHQYYIKLCGKGGGGYYLLWWNDPNAEPVKGWTKVLLP